MSKLPILVEQFREAIERLNEVLKQEPNEFMKDSAIQRFEFTFDLSWKVVKTFVEEIHGIECTSPKSCIREAYKQDLIPYDLRWLEMVDDRNKTSHLYNKKAADQVYARLKDYLLLFQKLLEKLPKTTLS